MLLSLNATLRMQVTTKAKRPHEASALAQYKAKESAKRLSKGFLASLNLIIGPSLVHAIAGS
ncbi:hypothetical protein BDD16_001993 [Sphaerotilus montanus]|uniref:Uncharacterized protein n=1 Tax=Sphaerotilus montanus TaxID=522889 RepID=A0A7Y9QWZ7_9BURK|nr:hypothetical protein [Sphaerotilus montanus]